MNITAENEYYVGRYSFFKLGMFMMSYDTIIILNIIIIFAKTENDWKLDLYVGTHAGIEVLRKIFCN